MFPKVTIYTQSLLGRKIWAELLVITKILLSNINIVHWNDIAKIKFRKVSRPEIVRYQG